MKAGKADRRITIERATTEPNGYGDEISTWSPLCTPWAEINYGRGDERRTAAQESASVAATFRVRANPVTSAVVAKDRIRFDGWAWDITSNVPYNRDARDITATTAFDAASSLPAAIILFGSAVLGASLTGTLRAATSLAGMVTASGAASGALSAGVSLAGAASAASGATGALFPAAYLAGGVTASATATGALTATATGEPWAGSAIATGVATGSLAVSVRMAGASVASGAAAGALTTRAMLSGASSGLAVSAGSLTTASVLAGSSSASAAAVGDLTVGSAPTYSTEAASYFAAMTVQPDATRKGLLDTLIVGLKNDGVWSLLDMLQIYAAHDAQAGRVDAVLPSRVAATANSPAFTADRGYTSDGSTSYLNTGFAPNAGVQYQLSSATLGYYINAGVDAASNTMIALGVTSGGGAFIIPRDASNFLRGRMNSTTSTTTAVTVASRLGSLMLSRIGTTVTVYKAGSALGTFTAPNVSIPTAAVFVGGQNSAGTLGGAINNRFAAAWAGAGLDATQSAALYTRLNTYLTAIGAN